MRRLFVLPALLLAFALAFALKNTPLAAAGDEEKVVIDTGYVVFRIGDKDVVVKGPNAEKFAPGLPKRPASVEGATVITMDTAPYIEQDRTFVPVRYLANALGVADANIKWDESVRLVTLSEPDLPKVEMIIGEKRITSNGKATTTDVAPVIRDARTMLPAKWVAEALGYTVEWDGATKTVLAYRGKKPLKEELEKVYKEFATLKASEKLTPEQTKNLVLVIIYLKTNNPEFYGLFRYVLWVPSDPQWDGAGEIKEDMFGHPQARYIGYGKCGEPIENIFYPPNYSENWGPYPIEDLIEEPWKDPAVRSAFPQFFCDQQQSISEIPASIASDDPIMRDLITQAQYGYLFSAMANGFDPFSILGKTNTPAFQNPLRYVHIILPPLPPTDETDETMGHGQVFYRGKDGQLYHISLPIPTKEIIVRIWGTSMPVDIDEIIDKGRFGP